MMDLTVSGIEKSFGATRVINGVDLRISANKITAILGPSGCGKTTLLRLIAGFDDPDAGVVMLGDQALYKDRRSVPPEKRHIGYVVQEGALFPHLTVASNITFGLSSQGRRDRSIVERMLELVGLDAEFAGRYPHQLSGGQQQRVALARALAPEPTILLLDEPFSSLDSRLRESTRRAVVETLRATATTTVMVTHDQAEAFSMADQVAVMHSGRFMDVAEPTRLYRQPATREAAQSTGDVIILPATVHEGRASTALGTWAVYPGTADGPCEVMIRPEQIRFCDPEEADLVRAQVIDSIFYGHEAILELECEDGLRIPARSSVQALPANGTNVGLRLDEPIHAFPRTEAL